jgi:hypothetical protein
MARLTLTKTLLGSALALSLFAAPAMAADVGEWDKNADASVDEQEFRAGFGEAGVFGDWDTDGDNMLSEDEFNAGIGDGTAAFNERFGENAFSEWDANEDDLLAEDEFYAGTYAGYDDDDDNVIEEPELSDLGDDMGDAGFWDV